MYYVQIIIISVSIVTIVDMGHIPLTTCDISTITISHTQFIFDVGVAGYLTTLVINY